MPDFTPAEIQDARENPKPGDVWIFGDDKRQIGYIGPRGRVSYKAFWNEEWLWTTSLSRKQFRDWTRNATLLRRGA